MSDRLDSSETGRHFPCRGPYCAPKFHLPTYHRLKRAPSIIRDVVPVQDGETNHLGKAKPYHEKLVKFGREHVLLHACCTHFACNSVIEVIGKCLDRRFTLFRNVMKCKGLCGFCLGSVQIKMVEAGGNRS